MKKIFLALAAFLVCGVCLAGAWGPGSFENDDALDWVQQCIESKGAGVIASALQIGLKANPLEAPEGSMAVAAAEVVAAAKGKPSKEMPQELREWLARQPKEEIAKLAPLARKALLKIKDAKSSELSQLWSESPKKQWASAISELEARLK
ncbi:DUF4259 domain-containing protein [Massilia horti]|uniref:DUF4259 domain-containing protein n=1 Tax=Massilia horti TaxID=2562153 RepID=A0A4Y9T849_9BURK|nr:DUF4259 domain-containing protein [Massilia horti]TFW33709.1 DUF4259 domain-containing protein [Massilia horti]